MVGVQDRLRLAAARITARGPHAAPRRHVRVTDGRAHADTAYTTHTCAIYPHAHTRADTDAPTRHLAAR